MLFTLRGGADGLVAPDVGCVCAAAPRLRRCAALRADSTLTGALRLCAAHSVCSFPGCLPEATPTPPAVSAVRQAAAELGLPAQVRPSCNGCSGAAGAPNPS